MKETKEIKKILYIHGLGGNSNGRFATVLRKNLGDDYEIIAPEIPIAKYT